MKTLRIVLFAIVILAMMLAGCAPTPTQAPVTSTEAPPSPTEAPPTGPTVGGRLVWALPSEPDTLDWLKTALLSSYIVDFYLQGTLLIRDASGGVSPYLAKSYTVSEDGLVYEFKLREDIKFDNGDPVTADDWVWTFKRAIDPETTSPVTAPVLGSDTVFEAVDKYTLRITLKEPNAPFLFNIADPGNFGPASQKAVEEGGENYGRKPVGTGPYMVKEWITGDHITLVRNPLYTWGPETYENKGPYYIEEIVFRIIPESTTVLSGLEAGDITFGQIQAKDLDTFSDTSKFQVFKQLQKGPWPAFWMNVSKPPFDKLEVRQAFNLALDRQVMLDLLVEGMGVIMYGPLSPSQGGYWDGVEQIGYKYDLERAKQLMQDAGYSYDDKGMLLTPEGEPFTIVLYTTPIEENWVKVAEIAKQQYEALGVAVEIQSTDPGVLLPNLVMGEYNITVMGATAPEADLLYLMYHSSRIQVGINISYVNDPDLDALLASTRTLTDPATRQEAINQSQKWLVENAIMVPLYASETFFVMSTDISGASMPRYFDGVLNLADAYMLP